MKDCSELENEELISLLEKEVKLDGDHFYLYENEILKRIPHNKKTDLTNIENFSEMPNEQLIQVLGEEVTFAELEGVITDEYHLIKKEILNRMSQV